MGLSRAPNRPQAHLPFVNPKTGALLPAGLHVLDEMWRQLAGGFVVVPCTATGKNLIVLTPTLTAEGAKLYANYMVFAAVAAQTSDGAVTGYVTNGTTPLATLKIYKTNGAAQAGAGDIVAGSLYLFVYNSALDSAAGGLVAK